MYKKDRNRQFTLEDFNQPFGLKMNPENRLIKKADLIPWDEIEERYAKLFPSHKGMPAKPLRVALGSLLIQKQYNYSDRAPQNISYPQDINLLNESSEKLEKMIDTICYEYNEPKPRTYRKNARKDYLALAKQQKRSKKSIRKAIKKQLQYVRRDIDFIETFLKEGKSLSFKDKANFEVIRKVYEQQLYMHKNKIHTVSDRIVSVSQPYIRPIVTPTEFGAKLDVTTRSSIALSILAMNVERLAVFSFVKFFVSIFQAKKSKFFKLLKLDFKPKSKIILGSVY